MKELESAVYAHFFKSAHHETSSVPFLFLLKALFVEASLSLFGGVVSREIILTPGRMNNRSSTRSHLSQQPHNQSTVTIWICLHLWAVCTCKNNVMNIHETSKGWISIHQLVPISPSSPTTSPQLLCGYVCTSEQYAPAINNLSWIFMRLVNDEQPFIISFPSLPAAAQPVHAYYVDLLDYGKIMVHVCIILYLNTPIRDPWLTTHQSIQ